MTREDYERYAAAFNERDYDAVFDFYADNPRLAFFGIEITTREELPHETRLTLDLGARNLNVAELRFEIPDAVFSRNCILSFSTSAADGGTRVESLSRGTLYRVSGDRDGSVRPAEDRPQRTV